MSTNCDACGYRDNEVKSGSAISEQGKKIILKVEDSEDLSRDILKVIDILVYVFVMFTAYSYQSETCGLVIPEIDLVLQAGTLGGRFTTLEGILDQVYEELSDKVFAGDSAHGDGRVEFESFLTKLKEVHPAHMLIIVF
jgi:zinc finger protein